MEIEKRDLQALIREKYAGNPEAPGVTEDLARLASGEPLAYVIGTLPFLGLTVHLDSHPLIPRPETEWWTEELAKDIGDQHLSVVDICAGSGAIGLSLLKLCPNARVSFGEVVSEHAELIRKNIALNNLDESRADIRTGDLFAPFTDERFNLIATNPPYIPSSRTLSQSVVSFEPHEALFAGVDGMDVIRRICKDAPKHLQEGGELWMECDVENIDAARELLLVEGFKTVEIRTDPYGRKRFLVAHL